MIDRNRRPALKQLIGADSLNAPGLFSIGAILGLVPLGAGLAILFDRYAVGARQQA